MTKGNKTYTLKEILLALIVLLGLLFATHPYGFIQGAEPYKGALDPGKPALNKTPKENPGEQLAGKEITKRLYKHTSENFYGGIYVECISVGSDSAVISVTVAEPLEMKRVSMKAGNSMNIRYQTKNYKLILKVVDSYAAIVVSIVEMID